MGIKSNYNKFIKQIAGDDIFKQTHLSQFAFKKIAIDTTLYLYKFKAAMGDRWISGFMNLIQCIRNNCVHCVFIFDGKSPIEKQAEQESRKLSRQKLEEDIASLQTDMCTYYKYGYISDNLNKLNPNVDKFNPIEVEDLILKKQGHVIYVCAQDFEQLQSLMSIMGIPFYTAPTEAEKFCSKLCLDGLVDAVLSDDTDVIAYTCPLSLSKLDMSTGICSCISHIDLITALNLSEQQFTEHCIMCGTDYNKNIPQVGSVSAYKLLRKHGSIDGIRDETTLNIEILNHKVVYKLFKEFDECVIMDIPYCTPPNFDELQRFVIANNLSINVSYYNSTFRDTVVIYEDI